MSVNYGVKDGAPRCVSRRKSDDKAKVDAETTLGLVSFVDERGAIDSLPKFVAANLERVPPLQSDVLDLCLAVNRIAVLELKMEQLMLNYVQAQVPQVPACVPRSTKPDATLTGITDCDDQCWHSAVICEYFCEC